MPSLDFRQKRFYYTVLYVLLCSGCYFFTINWHFFPMVDLQPSSIDIAIPYLSWTTVIYISYFFLLFLPLLVCEEDIFFNMYTAYLSVIGISCCIFFFFPTRYAWAQESSYTVDGDFYNLLRLTIAGLDGEFNACPSMHVSISLTGALTYLWHKRCARGVGFLIWGMLVTMSTLTAKRHFFIDVVAATVITLLVVATVNICKGKSKTAQA